jgi:hypothetical protein
LDGETISSLLDLRIQETLHREDSKEKFSLHIRREMLRGRRLDKELCKMKCGGILGELIDTEKDSAQQEVEREIEVLKDRDKMGPQQIEAHDKAMERADGED